MAKKKIQYVDKVKNNGTTINGIFTYEDANEIKEVVNNLSDDSHTHLNKEVIDVITQEDLNNYDDAVLSKHTHNNKDYLDNINQNLSTSSSSRFLNIDITNQARVKELNANLAKIDTVRTDDISSNTFVSGFGGEGYRIGKDGNGDYVLEIDNLRVRKGLDVYELTINEIKATNGSIWVSDGIEISSVTNVGGDYVCKIETDNNTITVPFHTNDIIRCQKFNGSDVKFYVARVISIINDGFTLVIMEGVGIPTALDKLVRIGNVSDTNRQGAIYLTSSDSGAPYIDVIDGVNSANLSGKTKVRMGKLDGIVDPDFGALSGYGLYAGNTYIKGNFFAQAGSNVYSKDETQEKIDDIKVGGTNLLKGGFTNGFWHQQSIGNSPNDSSGRSVEMYKLEIGEEYTFSMLKDTNIQPDGLWLTFRNEDETYHSVLLKDKVPFTFIAPSPLCTLSYDASYYTAYYGGNVLKESLPKLEKGNVVTDWSPAPEDVVDGIKVGGQNLFAYGDFKNKSKMTLESVGVEEVKIEKNPYQIGGYFNNNMLFFNGRNNDIYLHLTPKINLKKDIEYTISFMAKMATDGVIHGSSSGIYTNSGFIYIPFGDNLKPNNQWVKITNTFKSLDTTEEATLRLGIVTNNTYSWLAVTQIKIEEGNKATDWSPAILDSEFGNIYVRGTGLNQTNVLSGKQMVNGIVTVDDRSGGWQFRVYNPEDLSVYEERYFFYQDWAVLRDVLSWYNGQPEGKNKIIVINSYDYILLRPEIRQQLIPMGGIDDPSLELQNRHPWAFIGQVGIGGGAGFETYSGLEASAPSAELNAVVKNGKLVGKDRVITNMGNRITTAEFKIRPDQINLTVKEQTERIAADKSKRFRVTINTMNLDQNTFYPVVIPLHATQPITIRVERTLSTEYGVPHWSTHGAGFSLICTWTTNGNGWGTVPINRTIDEFVFAHANYHPVGSIGQLTNGSEEYIFVRGGSMYFFEIIGTSESEMRWPVQVFSGRYTGVAGQYVDPITDVVRPERTFQSKDEIKAGITITPNSVNVFGQSISMTGAVMFSSLAEGWGDTLIQGGKIRTDRLDVDTIVARQIRTSDDITRLSINENNDNMIKIRHTNGQIGIELGLVGIEPKLIFYSPTGIKLWEGGQSGIVYVNNTAEKWTSVQLCYLGTDASELADPTDIYILNDVASQNCQWSGSGIQLGQNVWGHALYNAGINAQTAQNEQYNGYHRSQEKRLDNWADEGWYAIALENLKPSNTHGGGYYRTTAMYLRGGRVINTITLQEIYYV